MRLTILMFNREFKMTTIIFIDTDKMTAGPLELEFVGLCCGS
jgi:hypothetical protein